jgi:hypothetical protein
MTNTFALTDYDVYEDEAYDNFRSKRPRRTFPSRQRILRRSKKSTRPMLGRPKVFIRKGIPKRFPSKYIKIRPKIVRGRPIKLPPIKVRRLPVLVKKPIKPKVNVSKVKVKRAPLIKKKTPINHLIKTTRPVNVKKPLSKTSKVDVKQIEATQKEAHKKAIESDGKTSKIVKIVAIVGLVGVTGFGIYKFIQNKKLSNEHISTGK